MNYYPSIFPSGGFLLPNPQWPLIEKVNATQRHKFSKEEDELLKKLVDKHGETNWMTIASHMKTRSPRQCRERYRNYLSSNLINGPWTFEEEQLLEEKVREFGQKWSKITPFFESRSDVNLKNHWTALINRQSREQQSILIKQKENEYVTTKKKNIEISKPNINIEPTNIINNEIENVINDNLSLTGSIWNSNNDPEWQPSSLTSFLNDDMMDFFI